MSRLHGIGTDYFHEFLDGITEDVNMNSNLDFVQQVGNRGDGIIDGLIHQPGYKVVIETKLHSLELVDKLLKYKRSFNHGETNLLIHLSSTLYSPSEVQNIKDQLENFQKDNGPKVSFFPLTYKTLTDQLEVLAEKYPFERELTTLSDDFAHYCRIEGLIKTNGHILRAMACGQSFHLNRQFEMYFDPAHRGYRNFDYLGIYNQKSVQFIGRVEANIVADLIDDKLHIHESDTKLTDEQKERLRTAIGESMKYFPSVNIGHRFFLLKDFHATDFKKVSKGGIMRVRYFDLVQQFQEGTMPADLKSVAEALKGKTWE